MTSKRPWMPLYVADYLADTQHLTITESGAYLHLLMYQWLHGKIPANATRLLAICKVSKTEWDTVEPVLRPFFTITSEWWMQKRLTAELEKSADISNKRKNSGSKGGNKRVANAKAKKEQNSSNEPSKEPSKHSSKTQDTSHFTLKKDSPSFSYEKEGAEVSVREGHKNGSQPNGELFPQAKPPPQPAAPPNDETELFRRGRVLLGKDAGGLITRLLVAKGRNPTRALAALLEAEGKQDAREYIGAIIRGPPKHPADEDRSRYVDPGI